MKEDQEKLSFLSRLSLILAMPALRWALPMLVILMAVTGLLIKPAMNIQNDDDVLKFLPQGDEKVVKFMDVGERFHGLQMAILGVETTEGDLFTPENLTFLRRLSRELILLECNSTKHCSDADGNDVPCGAKNAVPQKTQCVSNTTSFTEIKDIAHGKTQAGEDEASVSDLVPELPALTMEAAHSPELLNTLKDVKTRALSLDHVRGFLVSPDGAAAAIYAQVDDQNVATKEASDKIKERLLEIKKEMTDQNQLSPNLSIYYGGSPFIGGYSADQARLDMGRLSPWVLLIVIAIIAVTSKSLFATVIALLSVGVSIVWVLGGMSLLGYQMTLVSTSLPILLMALGSAYSIHLISAMLSRLDGGMTRKDAMRDAIIHTGPPIVVCVLTTAAGFFSFLAMDVEPMVEYGAAMGVATLIIMLVTFWIVSSACILFPIKPQKEGRAPKWAMSAMKASANAIYRHGKAAAVCIAILVVASAYFATKVEPHGDNSSLFAPGSIPVVADDFMNDRFGGSNFIQTEIHGDITSPLVLRQLERMTAYVNADERIAGVQSFSDIIIMVGGTMGDGQHIPASQTLAATLATLAYADDKSVAMMVENNPDAEKNWQYSLVQIRVRGKDISEGSDIALRLDRETQPLFTPRVAVARDKLNDNAKNIEREEMIEHVQWILKKYGRTLDHDTVYNALFNTSVSVSRDDIRDVLNFNLFDEDEAMVYLDIKKILPGYFAKQAETETGAGETENAAPRPVPDDAAMKNEALENLTDKVYAAVSNGTYSENWLSNLIRSVAQDDELDNTQGIASGIHYVHNEINDASVKKLRKSRSANIFAAAGIQQPSEKLVELTESAIWSLADDVVFLPRDKVMDLSEHFIETQTFHVTPSGYPIIYKAMNASVVHNQIVSLGYSFLMVFICLLFFTRSFILAAVSLIPASITVLVTFGVMGLFNIGMDVGSSMIAAISLSVGIDYACHLIWKFGRPKNDAAALQNASDRMLETTGWGVVINALEIGLGLSVLYFGELLPMRNFGVLTGIAMIVSAAASLALLSGLLRWAMKFVSKETPRPA